MHSELIKDVERLLKYLQQDEPIEPVETTLERINTIVNRHKEVKLFLSNEYFVRIIEEDPRGIAFLRKFIQALKDGAYLSLSQCVTESLVISFKSDNTPLLANFILDLIIDCQNPEELDVQINHKVFRVSLQSGAVLFFTWNIIQENKKLPLLRRAIDCTFPRSNQDGTTVGYDEIFQSINHAFNIINSLEHLVKQQNFFLEPFLLDDLRYSPSASVSLFGEILSYQQFEDKLFEVYRLPLLPLVTLTSFVQTHNANICIHNTGLGCLPPCSVQIFIDNTIIDIGHLEQHVASGQQVELYIENSEELYNRFTEFKKSQNAIIKLNFTKFNFSYVMIIATFSVGKLVEDILKKVSDTALPHELPLNNLSDKEFERLCLWVVKDATNERFTQVLWLNEDGGGERGRDVLATEASTGKSFVFQCKRVGNFHPSDIEEELKTFEEYVKISPEILPHVYVLFVSAAITDKTRERGNNLAKKIGMKIEYWPKSEIDHLVRTNRSVSERFWRSIR